MVAIPAAKKASCVVPKLHSERLDVTTWAALLILVLGAMLLILNESGVIAGIDTTTFGYVAIFSALILYLSGG